MKYMNGVPINDAAYVVAQSVLQAVDTQLMDAPEGEQRDIVLRAVAGELALRVVSK